MGQTLNTYKLTSLEEPSDEVLAMLMHEAFKDVEKEYKEVLRQNFEKMKATIEEFNGRSDT